MGKVTNNSVDWQELNDVINEYKDALEVYFMTDSIDEILEMYDGTDMEELEELIAGIQDENEEYEDASEAQPPRDPLIIDFGAQGIDLSTLADGVNFDLDNNGYAEKTAWIGTEDGFLALDRNANGVIDNGGELFGDQVEIAEGQLSSSGFEALSVLDMNQDEVIDEQDECYSKLTVWVDSNHNGYSEATELQSLAYYEIKEIHLEHTESSVVDESTGTMMAEFAKIVYQDDTETTISEFWFPINASDTTHGDVVTAGNVPSIEQALTDDETGELLSLVEEFMVADSVASRRYYLKKILYFMTDSEDIAVNSRGGNMDARDLHVIEQFMGRNFNGVGGSNPNANAANILKNIYKDIEDYYYNILTSYAEFGGYKTLIMEYEDENGVKKLDVTFLVLTFDAFIEQGEDMEVLIYDLGIYLKIYDKLNGTNYYAEYCDYYSGKSEDITESVNASKDSNTYVGTEGADNSSGNASRDYMFGEAGNDNLHGGNAADIIYGKAGNDTLAGGNDNDRLYGNDGDDVMDGGAGNDIMQDDNGNDTYVFTKGYGFDTIIDNGGSNKLSFANLTADDLLVNGTGDYDASIRIKGTNDTLVLKNFREKEELADYTLVFKDKTMHCTDAESPFKHIYGSESDDVLKAVVDGSIMHAFGGNDTAIGSEGKDIIYGNDGNDNIMAGEEADIIYGGADTDTLSGETGDDIIFGEAGNDTLDGGNGNDYLFGGEGDDIYVFAENYGRDMVADDYGISTIRLGDNLTMDKVSVYRVGDEAVIHVNETADMFIISGYAANEANYYMESGDTRININEIIVDGAEITINDLKLTSGSENSDAVFAESIKNLIASGAQYDYIVGGDAEDIIFGDGDTDRILAGVGSDIIYGGEGNDQLLAEDDNDFIVAGNGNDYINAGNGDDVMIADAGDDFVDGSAGNDTYYFNVGDGKDSIMDSEGNNTIMFGDGILSNGIKAYRDNWNDLLITFEGLDDTLLIKNYCIDEAARNFELVFADGSVYAATDGDSALRNISDNSGTEYMPSIYDNGVTIVSADGDDQLTGSGEADTLIGGTGNNRITGNAGNDSLDGGAGRDYLYGGEGSDTYIYKKGYGTDTFGDSQGTNYIEISGYSASEVVAFRTNWNDITLVFDGSGENGLYNDSVDKLVLEGFFTSEGSRNYYISFNGARYFATAGNSPLRTMHGTVNGDYMQGFDNNNITMYGGEGVDTLNGNNANDALYGGNGDDRILGFAGKDTLVGDAGNDYLEGGADDDSYYFNIGSGTDTINDNQGVNAIYLGEGLSKEGVIAYRTNWNDLTVTFAGLEDKLVLQGYFVSADNRKFDVTFADGSKYQYTDIQSPINQVYASEYDDWMSAWSDEGISLNGATGNDTLMGGMGNDMLIGGIGNDTLSGGAGDDIYKFNLGTGFDTVNDMEGVNKLQFVDIASSDAAFSYDANVGRLVITLSSSGESVIVNNYCVDNFDVEFADDVLGKVVIEESNAVLVNEPQVQE